MQLRLFASSDNMGAVVTNYTLYRNQGNNDEQWTQIKGYDFSTSGYYANLNTSLE